MFYSYALAVPASTLESAPATATLHVTAGTVDRVEIQFPAGCAGLVHVTVFHREHQAWPTNPDSDFSADNETITFNEDYPLVSAPYQLKLIAWNDDDTYPHTVTFHFGIHRPGIIPDWLIRLLRRL